MEKKLLKASAVSPSIRVADVQFNTQAHLVEIENAVSNGVDLLVFPRLSLCGCTCADLFFQPTLVSACEEGIAILAKATENTKTEVDTDE